MLANYTKACAKNVGGNATVFLTEAANISTVTVTAGEISALSMASGKTFHQLQADIDSIVHTVEATGTRTNIGYTHKIEMKFMGPSTELNVLRDALVAASACGLVAIVQDGNGECWLVGYNETDGVNRALFVDADNLASGATPTDDGANVVTISLSTTTGYLSLPFDDTTKGTIVGGSATFITYN